MKYDDKFLKWFYAYGSGAFLIAGVLNIYTLLITFKVLYTSQVIVSIIFIIFYFLLSFNFLRLYKAQAFVLKNMPKDIEAKEVDKIIEGAR